MAPKRKRSRPTHSGGMNQPPYKKKPVEEDEDILSDDVDGASDGERTPPSPIEIDDEPDSPLNETAEERRLRLARAYLRHVGVSEEASIATDGELKNNQKANNRLNEDDAKEQDDEEDDGSRYDDPENARLREQVLAESGRGVIRLADRVSSSFPLTVSCGHGDKKNGLTHVLSPTCVSLSRDSSSTAVSGGKDSRVIVWDVETTRSTRVFKPDDLNGRSAGSIRDAMAIKKGHVGPVFSTIISDDGNVIASGGMDSLIRIWDVRSSEPVTALRGHSGAVRGLALRAGSRQLFSAGQDRLVKIWDLGERAYIETLFGHGGEVNDIDAMITERALSCGRDGTVRLYKVAEGSQLLFRSTATMSIDTVSIINEQRFLSGGDDGSLCLWHLNKKKPAAINKWAHGKGLGVENWVSCVSALRNSDLAFSGAGDGKVRFWRCEDVPKLIEINHVDVGLGFVNGIAVGKRRNVMAVAVGDEHRLGRWSKIKRAKNSIKFISLPLEGEGE